MRIRKHAAKLLLGSACPPQQYSPPPPAAAVAADEEYDLQSVGDDGLFLCQLNCSPWDVFDSNHYYFQRQQGEEDQDEGKGIMGNVLGFGDDEGIFGISEAVTKSVVVAAAPYLDCEDEEEDGIDRKNNVKKRRRRRKKKEKEKENGADGHENDDHYSKSSSVVTVAKSTGSSSVSAGICKKNDGKGWHCNRPANPHHTLCDHHLTQLRSYSSTRHNSISCSNNVAIEEAADRDSVSDLARAVKKDRKKDDVPRVKNSRRPKTKAAVATSSKSAGDGYYYYSGFGLQRGKTRSDGRKEDAKAKESESESGDGSDGPIAGDDLDDDDDNTDDDEDVKIVGNVDNSKGGIRRKKRGRKPIKARSLKSFL